MALLYMLKAKSYLGVAEIKGAKHNKIIVSWLSRVKAWWSDDETAWCGTFVAECIGSVGLAIPKAAYRASSWLTWGQSVAKPFYGCIAITKRLGGNHVAFVVGKDEQGNILLLGGNQGDKVQINAFSPSVVMGYRYPKELILPAIASRKLEVMTKIPKSPSEA